MSLYLDYFYTSHIGNIRSSNQDNFFCVGEYMDCINKGTDDIISGTISPSSKPLFAVFDGMGGEEQGEMAAYIASEQMSKFKFQKDPLKSLLDYCVVANSEICNFAQGNNIHSMGTTAAMLAFTCKDITLCNIGDSKIFRFCDGVLEQISKDHVASTAFGMKPPLSQNLGIPPTELVIEPYFSKGLYNNNDVYIICSDGLTDMVTIEETQEVLNTKPVEEATQELLERALRNGGRDNITIIICKIKREPQWLSKLKIMLNI